MLLLFWSYLLSISFTFLDTLQTSIKAIKLLHNTSIKELLSGGDRINLLEEYDHIFARRVMHFELHIFVMFFIWCLGYSSKVYSFYVATAEL